MTKNIQGIGIDVSKASLEICLQYTNTDKNKTIPNTKKGILSFLKDIAGYQGKIVLESTGRYHLLAALLFSANGFDLRVINPLLAKKYSTASIHNNKTDKADAKILAEIAVKEKRLPAPFSSSRLDISLRQKLGFLSSLEKKLQALTSSIKGYEEFEETLELCTSPVMEEIKDMKKKICRLKEQLEQEIMQEAQISDHKEKKDKQDILTSIPGISPFMACILLQFFNHKNCVHVKQWIAYTGINVLAKQSGTWKGRGRISHRGNPYLRKRLFSCAWGAMMSNDNFRKYYDQLRKRGLSYVESLLVISRKLLSIAFTLLKKNEPFNPKICFPS